MIKFILLSNLDLKDVNPMECGEEYCATNFRAGPTSRQYYLLHYVFSGSGTFKTNNEEHIVSKGQIFVIHPFEVVQYRADPADPWHYCWVGFESSLDLPILDKCTVIDIPQVEHIFNAIKDSEQIEHHKELFICGKIYELLSVIEQPEVKTASRTDEYIKKSKQYIDINFMHDITVEEMAKNLNINRSYFSTIFRKHYGKSPQQYLIDVRLENAAELITKHGYSISDAAMSSGYKDVFNFSKMFKQKFGMSPSYYAYRREK